MRIQYLGTAAAEGIPAIFCECDTCKKARSLGGKNIRTRSQAIIDDGLLIDFPPDTYMHFLQYNLPLAKIKHCIITHSHADHLYPNDLQMRKNGFSHLSDVEEPMRFYAGESGYESVKAIVEQYGMTEVEPVLIKPFESFDAGGYQVTPLRASHAPHTSPVVFLIEKDGKTLLYSNDTSDYPEDTWDYLQNNPRICDLVSLDCTEADKPIHYVGHMNLERCVAMRERLLRIGMADEKTVFVLNHFSHNGGHVTYEEFVSIAEKCNFIVSYDGMNIKI